MTRKAALYTGKVFHARHTPFYHKFTYRVFSLCIDLDEIEAAAKRLKFFSYNKWNILSFFDKDHGKRDGSRIRDWIENAAADKNIEIQGGKIIFLGFPRLWGYAFNPICLYYCYDRNGVLKAIMHQVKNTFGEQHGYLLEVDPNDLARPEDEEKTSKIAQQCDKVFHVSPFIQMDCLYKFRVTELAETFDVAIHQFTPDGKILTATWNGNERRLTDGKILKTVLLHPLMTLKVTLAIHWEALWLWTKGAKYIPKPAPPTKDVS